MQIKRYKDCQVYQTKLFKYRILNEETQDTHQLIINHLVVMQLELFTLSSWNLVLDITTSINTISLITPTFNLSIYV